MEEEKFNTQLEDKLKRINIPITAASETTIPGAKPVGAEPTTVKTMEEALNLSEEGKLVLKDLRLVLEGLRIPDNEKQTYIDRLISKIDGETDEDIIDLALATVNLDIVKRSKELKKQHKPQVTEKIKNPETEEKMKEEEKNQEVKTTETSMESGEEKNGFLVDEGVAKLYMDKFVEKTKAENKIKKFQAEIMKNIADSIKKGDVQSQNEIALGVFEEAIKKTKTKDTKNKIEILASYYRTKIEEEKKQKESESGETQTVETKLGESKPAENESVLEPTLEPEPESESVVEPGIVEPRAGFKIIRPTENEPDQKYSNVLKTKRFNDKGDELYIQEYNEGKIKCFITEKGKKPSPIILSQSQFDDALRKYARVEETTWRTIPAKESRQEGKETAQESQEVIDELKRLKISGEVFLSEFLNGLKEEDWNGVSQENMIAMQRIMTEADIVRRIKKDAKFVRKEDAEKIAKKIVEEII